MRTSWRVRNGRKRPSAPRRTPPRKYAVLFRRLFAALVFLAVPCAAVIYFSPDSPLGNVFWVVAAVDLALAMVCLGLCGLALWLHPERGWPGDTRRIGDWRALGMALVWASVVTLVGIGTFVLWSFAPTHLPRPLAALPFTAMAGVPMATVLAALVPVIAVTLRASSQRGA